MTGAKFQSMPISHLFADVARQESDLHASFEVLKANEALVRGVVD